MDIIVTTAVKKVMVLTSHPSGVARSSHRSLSPRGQMVEDLMGARIGKVFGFGTQVEDLSIWLVLVNRLIDLGGG